MGMSFQDLVSQDIKNVFLNPGEFGTRHMVNQRPMCIIIDENELTEREKKQFGRGRDGIYHKSLLFYVSGKDFGPLPSPEQVILLDGAKYLVKEAVDEDGIYSVSLEAGRA
ncbi:hypothetical protein [Otoolea muris]|uniref:hypothetical protein n=1 Tax=Otoolea muris TaxID=2941515 RepID=UPI00203FA2FA|nr:hypothetical protein [Otoolea muris]